MLYIPLIINILFLFLQMWGLKDSNNFYYCRFVIAARPAMGV